MTDRKVTSSSNFLRLQSVLSGKFNDWTIQEIKPNKKFIVFVSSTFTDTHKERNVLQERILPELQRRGAENGVQVLFYDMRFGIKDESSLDHTTWQCCMDGIKDCQEKSDGIFFLSLQGDKYGYRPLPKLIDRIFFEQAIQNQTESQALIELACKWYRLNENYLPAKFELNNLPKSNDNEYWEIVLPRLRDELLKEYPFEENFSELRINRSITEWEVFLSEKLRKDSKASVWIKRDFDCETAEFVERPMDFNDSLNNAVVERQLVQLRQMMSECFDVVHPLPLQNLSMKDYVTGSDVCTTYLQKWEIVVKNRLQDELESCIELSSSWTILSVQEFGLTVSYLEEMLHHTSITFEKATAFLGREELLEELLTLTTTPLLSDQLTEYSAISGAVIGQSGTGKTSLMAKIATLISSKYNGLDSPPIISRYCGTSALSLHGKNLIQSICLQLLVVYEEKVEINRFLKDIDSQDFEEALSYFGSLLKLYPVILFIDSVDQLSNKDEARTKLSFLKNLKVHEKSKIIISTLPDEYDEMNKQWKYRYLCEKVVRDHKVPVVEMKHHSADEATIRSLLERLLDSRKRKISEDQWSVVLRSAREEPTMLYLNLSLEVITKWRSWERDVELRPTVKGLIHQIFEGLEKYYGYHLIIFALGFLTFSRDGISDQEMIDCLSRQPDVLQEVCQYWQGVKTIPLHVWLRVKQAIKALLAEKNHACMKWYHRQLWEAAEERYYGVKKDCHRMMGRYFSAQPLCLTDLEVWHYESKVNDRRVKEGYYNLCKGEFYEEAVKEMCSFEMVCASSLCDDAYHSLNYLSKIRKIDSSEVKQLLDHYCRWLRMALASITIDPRHRISCLAGEEPVASIVKKENTRRLQEKATEFPVECPYTLMDMVDTYIERPLFGSLLSTWIGHAERVNSVCWDGDGNRIASGSSDGTVKIWDAYTGEVISTLNERKGDRAISIVWNSDGTKIASASIFKMITIWDASTFEAIKCWKGHNKEVASLSWSPDGTKIASGSFDHSVKVWDALTGELLKTFFRHSKQVMSVAWNHDGSRIASGSWDATIRIWDICTDDSIQALKGHKKEVYSVSWNQDGSKIASGSLDKTIKIWNSSSHELISTLSGYNHQVTSVVWIDADDKLAFGSSDCTIKICNPLSGEILQTLTGHSAALASISWSSSRRQIVSSADDNVIKVWSLSEETSALRAIGSVTSVSWNPVNSIIAVGSEDCFVRLWDSTTGMLLDVFIGHQDAVKAVVWSPDGTKIASGSKKIKIWDSKSKEELHSFSAEARSISWCQNKIIYGLSSGALGMLDLLTGESRRLQGHGSFLASITRNQDGSKFVTGSWDFTIKVFDFSSRAVLHTLEGHDDRVASVSIKPDSTFIASGSWDKTIKIWDSSSGKLLRTISGHLGKVTVVAWQGNGCRLASGSDDKTIKIWDATTGELLKSFAGHHGEITSLSWEPNGQRIASGSLDQTVKIWYL